MGAEKGTLALMVGGDVAAMERARPALEVLGTVYHCGTVGAGQIVKLANNAISMTTFAIIEEARAMARAHGADMSQLMKIIGQSTGRSFVQASRHSNHGTRGETGRKERWVISRPLLLLRLRDAHLRDLGAGDALGGALLDAVARVFADGSQHGEQQAANRASGIDGLVENDKVHRLSGDQSPRPSALPPVPR